MGQDIDWTRGPPAAAGIVLRPCARTDIPEIAAIYGRAVLTGTASFEVEPPDAAEMERRWTALEESGHPYLVATGGAELVGYAYAGPYRARLAYRGTVETSIYVREDQRGRGLGRLLLTALIAEATARGFRQMVAVVGDSANVGSIGVHAALGFADAGLLRSVGWKHGRWLDTVLMQRSLGEGDGTPAA